MLADDWLFGVLRLALMAAIVVGIGVGLAARWFLLVDLTAMTDARSMQATCKKDRQRPAATRRQLMVRAFHIPAPDGRDVLLPSGARDARAAAADAAHGDGCDN